MHEAANVQQMTLLMLRQCRQHGSSFLILLASLVGLQHRTHLISCPYRSVWTTLQASLLILSPSSGHSEHVVHTLELTLSGCREACKLDPKYITNFGEEVVRGQPVFVLSILLQKLEPMLREAAGVAPWQVSRRHDA
jgi:hypothetical protein